MSKKNIRLVETQIAIHPKTKKVISRFIHAAKRKKNIGSMIYDVEPKKIWSAPYDSKRIKKSDGGISGVWINPKYRRKGIGSLLFKRIEKMAKKDRKKRLVLDVLESNKKAQGFYKANGFKPIAKRKIKDGKKSISFIMMAKELK